MKKSDLVRRRSLLEALGSKAKASRASWSHDFDETITFDAWEHRWLPGTPGRFETYPLRTNGEHYNLATSKKRKSKGHTRWQKHVDLVLKGARKVRAIVPVAKDSTVARKSTLGWLPMVVEGTASIQPDGEVWFTAERVVQIKNAE